MEDIYKYYTACFTHSLHPPSPFKHILHASGALNMLMYNVLKAIYKHASHKSEQGSNIGTTIHTYADTKAEVDHGTQ
jgi:hypothetical protein